MFTVNITVHLKAILKEFLKDFNKVDRCSRKNIDRVFEEPKRYIDRCLQKVGLSEYINETIQL